MAGLVSAKHSTSRTSNIRGCAVRRFNRLCSVCLNSRFGAWPAGRMWDLRTGRSVLLLEGHVKPILSLDFAPNGAAPALHPPPEHDRAVCVFDPLRQAMFGAINRRAHTSCRHTFYLRFSSCRSAGYHMASGSEDHTVRIWDLRKKQSLYTIPAHQSLVSQVSPSSAHVWTDVAHSPHTLRFVGFGGSEQRRCFPRRNFLPPPACK